MKISSVDLNEMINVGTANYKKNSYVSKKDFDKVLSKNISKAENKYISNSKKFESDNNETTIDKSNADIEDGLYNKQIVNDEGSIDESTSSVESVAQKSDESQEDENLTDSSVTNDTSTNRTDIEILLAKLLHEKSYDINAVNKSLIEESNSSVSGSDSNNIKKLLAFLNNLVSETGANTELQSKNISQLSGSPIVEQGTNDISKLASSKDILHLVNSISKNLDDNNGLQLINNSTEGQDSNALQLLRNLVGEKEAKEVLQILASSKDKKAASDILNLLLKRDGAISSKDLTSLLNSIKGNQQAEFLMTNSQLGNSEASLENDTAKIASLIAKGSSSEKIKQEKVLNGSSNNILVEKGEASADNISLGENGLQEGFTEQESNSDSNNASVDVSEDKEDKLLKSIISSDNKAGNRVVAFQTHLNRLRDASTTVDKISQPSTISSTNMVNDVVKVIKYMNVNNLKELTVKVNPLDLGEMTIKISMEGSVLKASISASNKDTYNVLNSNVADLKNSLSNSQIKVQDVAINIYNDDTTFFSNSFDRNGQNSNEQNRRGTQSNRTIEVEEGKSIQSVEKIENNDNNLSVLA